MTEKKQTVQDVLHSMQKSLKAPKSNENKFGGYKYRSCEDILEAAKPLLPDGATLVIYDDIVLIGDRYYVKAKAELIYKGESVVATAFARESAEKKGMDASQITGAASSYARKYALNGLFLIDDTKDADATNDHKKEVVLHGEKKKISVSPIAPGNQRTGDKQIDHQVDFAIGAIDECTDLVKLKEVYVFQYKTCKDMGATEDQLALITQQKDSTKVRLENMALDGSFKQKMEE